MLRGTKTGNCLTVRELEKQFRPHDLPMHDNKNESIIQVLEANPGIENTITGEEAESETNTALPRRDDLPIVQSQGINHAFIQRELELLRQERELLRKEIQILKRQRTSYLEDSTIAMQSTIGLNIKMVSELLPEFSDETGDFRTWRQHLDLLRKTYQLEDSAIKILLSLRLKGKALKWFYAKEKHLEIAEFLDSMSSSIDHRPSQLTLWKRFENRLWQKNESFYEYYFDKNQVRMRRLEKVEDILDTFHNVTLRDELEINGDDQEDKKSISRQSIASGNGSLFVKRCFNCSTLGHISKNCMKPWRKWGSCFRCGSYQHHVENCTQICRRRKY
ncbi:uncharacterized protein LOC105196067 isoform X2 [Solenopsis invicta]|uniref:uncharacterized protein LOC105196067 isoform X2 n=1 Tax=Solenopsis invicta TaxID=13686 RepID=UPI000595E4C2|nr:uncharacterized protein LOC105196067 isoform X2 [Solenopsis invicta]